MNARRIFSDVVVPVLCAAADLVIDALPFAVGVVSGLVFARAVGLL